MLVLQFGPFAHNNLKSENKISGKQKQQDEEARKEKQQE
jgi:hypothetical protein